MRRSPDPPTLPAAHSAAAANNPMLSDPNGRCNSQTVTRVLRDAVPFSEGVEVSLIGAPAAKCQLSYGRLVQIAFPCLNQALVLSFCGGGKWKLESGGSCEIQRDA